MTIALSKSLAATKRPRIVGVGVVAVLAAGVIASVWGLEARFPGLPAFGLATVLSAASVLAVAWIGGKVLRWRAHIWLGSYMRASRCSLDPDLPLDVCFGLIDHFEPNYGGASVDSQLARVSAWESAYGRAIQGHADSDGQCPKHSWFFPVGLAGCHALPVMSGWSSRGWGETEYHLHHDDRPEIPRAELREMIRREISLLQRHGAVSSGRYGFVHGMFALAGGNPRFCRNTYELETLIETGCYADFSFPAKGTPAQPRHVNRPVYVRSNGVAGRPYDRGTPAEIGKPADGLLMIPGPMGAALFRPVIDDANIGPAEPPSLKRLRRWVDCHVHVGGRPNWVFILAHTHSATEEYQAALWAGAMQGLWADLEDSFMRPGTRLHYVTARETYNIIRAAQAGHGGNPGDYRDFEVPRPDNVLKVLPKARVPKAEIVSP